MEYTARLTGNRRDVETLNPKCLIIDIDPSTELERDHCWVDLTPELTAIQPAGHQKPRKIRFTADLKEYPKRGTITQHTLTNIQIV